MSQFLTKNIRIVLAFVVLVTFVIGLIFTFDKRADSSNSSICKSTSLANATIESYVLYTTECDGYRSCYDGHVNLITNMTRKYSCYINYLIKGVNETTAQQILKIKYPQDMFYQIYIIDGYDTYECYVDKPEIICAKRVGIVLLIICAVIVVLTACWELTSLCIIKIKRRTYTEINVPV